MVVNKKNKYPNFLGIGVQRAATTWVYECLKEHPEIFVPEKKELHFFNNNFSKGIAWYLDFFASADGFKAVGEVTPNYINIKQAIPRIHDILPDAKLFVILRNPVDRAYSAYRLLNSQFKDMNFETAVKTSGYLVKVSLYAEDLERLYKYFSTSQVRIFLYEDIKQDPQSALESLFAFLGVDHSFRLDALHQHYNAILFPEFQRVIKNLKMDSVFELFKQTALGKMTKEQILKRQRRKNERSNTAKNKKLTDTGEDRFKHELKQFFKKDILKTQDLINRDLSIWL